MRTQLPNYPYPSAGARQGVPLSASGETISWENRYDILATRPVPAKSTLHSTRYLAPAPLPPGTAQPPSPLAYYPLVCMSRVPGPGGRGDGRLPTTLP